MQNKKERQQPIGMEMQDIPQRLERMHQMSLYRVSRNIQAGSNLFMFHPLMTTHRKDQFLLRRKPAHRFLEPLLIFFGKKLIFNSTGIAVGETGHLFTD